MKYEEWRDDVFGKPVGTDPVTAELLRETYELSLDETLEHIDTALCDDVIPLLYSSQQIAIGLQLTYSYCCSDMPFAYIEAGDDARRIRALTNLGNLYAKYFDKYCTEAVKEIGDIADPAVDGGFHYLCYMFWDIFVVYPGNSSAGMIAACLGVMDNALQSLNDRCKISALHGLGHFTLYLPAASEIIDNWLQSPTTINSIVIRYANEARTGGIQ